MPMGLMMRERQAVTRELALEYKRATKKRKGEILDSLVGLTEYNRSYAARVLRQRAREVVLGTGRVGGVKFTLVEDQRSPRTKRRRRPRVYGKEVLVPLQRVWVVCDGICGKRLAPYLRTIVSVLERVGEMTLDDEVRRKLIRISPATIDRLLAPARKRYQLRARSQTKPGTLLKHQIPIRTWSDWNEARPGFVEIDLVSHEGGDPRGEFAYTLDATDICTGWTETVAVRNRAELWVFAGLKEALARFPFKIRGIDSDNGSEFINNHLVRYCKEQKITFTRSRPYRKNDNCFVEQKNSSVVRRTVGYARHDTPEELELLNELYSRLRLYANYFQPVMKLVEKTRTGSRVSKKYDKARTPYGRVLTSRDIAKRVKQDLRRGYKELNPVPLGREIDRLVARLHSVAERKAEAEARATLEYIST
jgi:transposase InsO family protein